LNEIELIKRLGLPDEIVGPEDRMWSTAWICFTCGDDHRSQTDPLPGALPVLSGHHVRDLEHALPGDSKSLEALTTTG
jgi:hypothetical protein